MAEEKIQYDWQLKSAELATIINCHTTGEQVPLDAFVPKSAQQREKEREDNIIYDPALNKVFRKMIADMYPELNQDYKESEEK